MTRQMASPVSSNELQTQWARVRGRLRSEFGEAAYRNWLKKLSFVGLRGPELQLAVPTRFIRDWIGTNYSDRLLALWVTENPAIRSIELVVEAGSKHVEEDGATAGRGTPPAGNGGRNEAAPAETHSIRASRSRISSSASPTSSPMRPLTGSRTPRPCRSIRCSSTAALVSARPT
jgi:chromosomal replication initiator protein